MSTETYILVGVISGAFGIKGEVKIKTFTQEPMGCLAYGPLMDKTGTEILTPIKAREVKNAIAAYCEQVTTREDAEALKGTELYVPRRALPEPDEDDFYYSDLVGLQVKTTDGQNAGTVIAVHEFGSNDMLEIKPTKKSAKDGKSQATWFHPFTKIGVPKVDIPKGRLIIQMLEVVNAKNPNGEEEE